MYSSGKDFGGSRYLPAVLLVITVSAFFLLQIVIGPTAQSWRQGNMGLYHSGGRADIDREPPFFEGTSLTRDSFTIEDKEPFEITITHWLNYLSEELVLWPGRGMMPLKVEVRNKGECNRKLDICFYEAANLDQSLIVSYSKSLEIAAGETKFISFFLPLSEYLDESSSIECVAWDGETKNKVGSLIKKKAGLSDSFDMVGATSPLYARSIVRDIKKKFYLAKFDPLSLPADWRVYSSMDGFFITGDEWIKFSELHRKALLDWVNTGGVLFINGGNPSLLPAMREYGWGHIFTLEQTTENSEQLSALYKKALDLVSEKKLQSWKDPLFRAKDGVKKDMVSTSIAAMGLHDISEKPRAVCERELVMLPDDVALTRVPGKWVVYAIAVFLLVGPVSFYLLSRSKESRRLLRPALFVASMGLFIVIFAIWPDSESNGTGNRFVFVQLSPDSPKAYVSQSQIMMTFPSIRRGMAVGEDTLILADEFVRTAKERKWVAKSSIFRNEKGILNCFSGGTLQHHHLSRYTSLEGGVCVVSREGDAPVLYSTLPVVLKDLVYTDENGRMWMAEELLPQTRVALVESSFGKNNDTIAGKGYFIAHGESCPGIPIPTLERVKWADRIVFRGLVHKKGAKE